MKRIPAGRLFAVIDDEDFGAVSQYTWCLKDRSDKKEHYVYRYIRIDTRKYDRQLLHDFLMNPPDGKRVDHKDGNGLNNRRKNLRIGTQQQNSFNQRPHTPRPNAPYKGVRHNGLVHGKYHLKKPWLARIRHNNELTTIGFFSTPERAARAYNRKARELFGEFANLNRIPRKKVAL